LEELFRITNKYLILLEPSYEFASDEGKKRMESHGYVKHLYTVAKNLGYKIIEHRLFDLSMNPLNPTGLMIIEKNKDSSNSIEPLACPITQTDLVKYENEYFSPMSLLAYPIIGNIPCLLPQNAIIASHFMDKI
jgi:uncharacterized protein YbaR (Trm112 family)